MDNHVNMVRNPADQRWYALFGVLALAAIVRIWGIQHDLPYSFYGDEQHFVKRALSFGSGDLNPHWFHKPAFYMYLLFGEYGVYYCVGWLLGSWNSVDEFAVSFIRDPSAFYLIGRLTTLGFGVATIWGVYCIGERHFSKSVGLYAALLLALTYGHVEASRVVKADVPAACLGVWAMYFLLNYMQQPRWVNLALASVFAGLGVATKYYTVLMLVPIICVVLLVREDIHQGVANTWKRRLGVLLAGVSLFWGSYFIGSPYSVLDARGRDRTVEHFRQASNHLTELLGVAQPIRKPQVRVEENKFVEGALDYARRLLSQQGMGMMIGAISLMGCLYLLFKRSGSAYLITLYSLLFAFVSVLISPGYAGPRHQCPLYPFLTIGGAALIAAVVERIQVTSRLVYSFLFLLMLFPTWHVAARAMDLSKNDTRNIALHWIEQNIAAGTRIVVDENGPSLLWSAELIDERMTAAKEADRSGQFTAHYDKYLKYQRLASHDVAAYYVFEIRRPWWRKDIEIEDVVVLDSEYDRDMGNPLRPVGVRDYDYYLKNGYKYAVVHRPKASQFDNSETSRSERDAYDRFYADLFERGELIQEFQPNERDLHGPVVRIYRFTDGGSE